MKWAAILDGGEQIIAILKRTDIFAFHLLYAYIFLPTYIINSRISNSIIAKKALRTWSSFISVLK